MTPEELKEAAQNTLRRAKEKALPIYFSRADVLMAEYPDGHIEVVKKD